MRLKCLSSNNPHAGKTWEGENCSYLINNCKYFNNDNKIVILLPCNFKQGFNTVTVDFSFMTSTNELWFCHDYDPNTNLITKDMLGDELSNILFKNN